MFPIPTARSIFPDRIFLPFFFFFRVLILLLILIIVVVFLLFKVLFFLTMAAVCISVKKQTNNRDDEDKTKKQKKKRSTCHPPRINQKTMQSCNERLRLFSSFADPSGWKSSRRRDRQLAVERLYAAMWSSFVAFLPF